MLKNLRSFTLKVVSRCNLNCSYCYEFNKADQTWKNKPKVMSELVFLSFMDKLRKHVLEFEIEELILTFHGGEPFLAGIKTFESWLSRLTSGIPASIKFKIQTNGTLINEDWVRLLKQYNFSVGVSIDGDKKTHDRFRVYHSGKGSFDDIKHNLDLFNRYEVNYGILTVINPYSDPIAVHKSLLSLGTQSISYLYPDGTHDYHDSYTIAEPVADYLIPIFDYWWANQTMNFKIQPFLHITELILGAESRSDTFGNSPTGFLFIDTDGQIESLDVLKVCGNGMAHTSLNVLEHDFSEIPSLNNYHSQLVLTGTHMPTACLGCPEKLTCGGGYIPHRYSRENSFNNPSIWCSDILKIFNHLRKTLEVDVNETAIRKQVMEEMFIHSSEKICAL